MAKKSAKKLAASKSRKSAEVIGTDKDLLKALDGRRGVRGGFWRPTVIGDTITGQVLSIGTEDGKYGEQVKVIIGTDTGALSLYANWSLEQGLISECVNTGDTVGIRYVEDVPGRGKPMRAFAVVRKGGKGKTLAPTLANLKPKAKKGRNKRK